MQSTPEQDKQLNDAADRFYTNDNLNPPPPPISLPEPPVDGGLVSSFASGFGGIGGVMSGGATGNTSRDIPENG